MVYLPQYSNYMHIVLHFSSLDPLFLLAPHIGDIKVPYTNYLCRTHVLHLTSARFVNHTGQDLTDMHCQVRFIISIAAENYSSRAQIIYHESFSSQICHICISLICIINQLLYSGSIVFHTSIKII